MKMKLNKLNWCVISICTLCFVLGIGIGYIMALYAGNGAHRADIEFSCPDGGAPDSNGCCSGETYTDMGDLGFNCCPDGDGDCYPPIK